MPITVTPVPGKPALLLGAFDIASLGYLAEEFFISGPASSYSSAAELGTDGRWSVTTSDSAEFATRMVVLTPADRAQFNGTVLVEWLNVSGGIDAPAVWMMAHREMVRAGYGYVAVSAQRVGVEGGVNLMGVDMSLKSQDPKRYAALCHPGDAFSYDIFSQAGRIVREGQRHGVLRELRAEHVVALGRVPIGAVYDDVYQRHRPAGPGLRRLFGAFAVRARRAAGRRFDIRRVGEQRIPRGGISPRPARPTRHHHHRNRPIRRSAAGLLQRETA